MTDAAYADRAAAFARLHVPGRPLALANVWDVASARWVAAAGARALATSSWAVADALGHADGEALPFEAQRALAAAITAASDLPLSVDMERGYGEDPGTLAANVRALVGAGAVGVNLEDGLPGSALRPTDAQASRLSAARAAADALGAPLFINARTDVFFVQGGSQASVEDALARAEAYGAAGASGLFVPGLADPRLIAELCRRSPLPVNVMTGAGASLSSLAELGVARVSLGPATYLAARAAVQGVAAGFLGG